MKSSYVIAALITLVAVGWVASGMISLDGHPMAAEQDLEPPAAVAADEAGPLVRVRVRHQRAEDRLDALVVLGETRASRQVEVRAETAGRVEAVPVAEGARVTTGDTLARLAMDDRLEQLSRAEAAVARWEDRERGDQSLVSRNVASRRTLMETREALEAARAELAAVRLDIERVDLKAPFDGVLEARLAEVGDSLSSGDPVARVVDLDPLTVVAKVSEADIDRVSLGQAGTATLVTGEAVEGRVAYIARVADGVTRTFAVELDVPNPDGAIPQGMTAELRLPLSTSRAHRISPAVLSLNDQGAIGVKVVDAESRVAFHPVVLAGDDAGGLWVEGLPDPVTLIVVGQEFVRVGQRVETVAVETIAANARALAEVDRAALEAGRAPTDTIDTLDTLGEGDGPTVGVSGAETPVPPGAGDPAAGDEGDDQTGSPGSHP
ncbi:efflux RND transporter periplasmic adaptor subunit [Roseospira visakhapatnamensis]|uniref:Multidrug efflux system membrane fusion protein n=1 Tax=Roseospira visakhapatnamensis TaxID=390880 RepID=A0A7W6R9K5_9PROT|nr:efflux RND transporter periplasmic adaptor subunit [Roseospira visakhapatnamensis]MBB4264398.1 multidrug efflux system membrane fusion protein [Roseospira visakhapatnamensis]